MTPDPTSACEQDAATIDDLRARIDRLEKRDESPDVNPCGNCRDVAASILDDPGPLLAALAEAGVLHVEKCCDQAWREMEAFGGTRIYTCDGPCARYQYRTEWRPADE